MKLRNTISKALLVMSLASAFTMSGVVSNILANNPIPYPADLDTKTEGASSAPAMMNHKNSPYYPRLDFYNMKSNDHLTMISHYRTYQQSRENTCAPAAVLTVLYHNGITNLTEMDLAKGMNTQLYPIGTNKKDMVNYLKTLDLDVQSSLDGKTFDTYESFQAFVVDNLKDNTPILVENVEWGGHWRAIIGYDTMGTDTPLDDTIILADPYDTSDHDQASYAINNAERLYAMWLEHSMLPKDQQNQQWITITKR